MKACFFWNYDNLTFFRISSLMDAMSDIDNVEIEQIPYEATDFRKVYKSSPSYNPKISIFEFEDLFDKYIGEKIEKLVNECSLNHVRLIIDTRAKRALELINKSISYKRVDYLRSYLPKPGSLYPTLQPSKIPSNIFEFMVEVVF